MKFFMQRIKYEWRNLYIFVSALSSSFLSVIHCTRREVVFVRFAYIKNISIIAYGERRNSRRNRLACQDPKQSE